MGRRKEEICTEIAKVEKARQAAIKKESRCTQRLEELQQELNDAEQDVMTK